ncbi:MAG: hypothetical protein UHD64_06545 [Bacteroidales bacterium]|nr:hypothetical protein [Bacteroidales bacterium]
MSLIRRSSLWGTIGIILIMILISTNIYTHLHFKNECEQLENLNKALSLTVNEQTITIQKIQNKNADLNIYISELERKNKDLEQKDTTPPKITEVNNDDFKSYMSYTTITSRASKQLKLQQQAHTDNNGLRCINGRPLVAIGTGWNLSVGDIALITCENGNNFEVVVGDIKANVDTKSDNKTTSYNNCRCEFIVDMSKLNSTVKKSGNVAVLDQYNGYVTNIQKIG